VTDDEKMVLSRIKRDNLGNYEMYKNASLEIIDLPESVRHNYRYKSNPEEIDAFFKSKEFNKIYPPAKTAANVFRIWVIKNKLFDDGLSCKKAHGDAVELIIRWINPVSKEEQPEDYGKWNNIEQRVKSYELFCEFLKYDFVTFQDQAENAKEFALKVWKIYFHEIKV
jgi:hypothetical protein